MSNYGTIKKVSDDGQSAIVDAAGIEINVQLMRPLGDMATPIKGDVIAYSEIKGNRESISVGYFDSKVEPTKAGGRLLYSRDSDGNKQASIELTPDGKIFLNGDSKSLVTHGDLNTALQTFLTALNARFTTVQPGTGTPGGLSIDISSSKTNTLKTDG